MKTDRRPHNPDRVRRSKVPEGWRFLTRAEVASRRKLRIRVWEVGPYEESPEGYWGPIISVCLKPTEFSAIRRA